MTDRKEPFDPHVTEFDTSGSVKATVPDRETAPREIQVARNQVPDASTRSQKEIRASRLVRDRSEPQPVPPLTMFPPLQDADSRAVTAENRHQWHHAVLTWVGGRVDLAS